MTGYTFFMHLSYLSLVRYVPVFDAVVLGEKVCGSVFGYRAHGNSIACPKSEDVVDSTLLHVERVFDSR